MLVYDKIFKTSEYLKNKIVKPPQICIVLGSGLGALADNIENKQTMSYSDIPNWPLSTVSGHNGRLIFGMLQGHNVVVMQGRVHYYEGYNMEEVTFPIRVLGVLGIKVLVLTNASGGISPDLKPGDIVAIQDHINFMATNPLIGKNLDEFGTRFPDMTHPYDKKLLEILKNIAKKKKNELKTGTYMAFSGPSFETPAEINMARFLGADIVGMSTMAEVIIANHMGIRVCGLSCVSNAAAGITGEKLTHQEVMDNMKETSYSLNTIISALLKELVL